MIFAHISDIHSNLDIVPNASQFGIECLITTGDFFPNITRGNLLIEPKFQAEWFELNHINIFAKLFDHIKKQYIHIIIVDGNHDFISLADKFIEYGYPPELVHKVEVGKSFEFHGYIWAGYPNIPYIIGEWNYETHIPEMKVIVDKTFNLNPDILVTHCPPQGILSGQFGCSILGSHLSFKENNVKYIFSGHCHNSAGINETSYAFKAYNSATKCHIINIPEKGKEE